MAPTATRKMLPPTVMRGAFPARRRGYTHVAGSTMVPMSTTALTDIYDLPQEYKDFRDTIRQIVDEKIRPRAAEIDATGEYPHDIRKLLAEQDILALPFDEQYGGTGTGHADAPDRGRGDRQGVRLERADPDDPGARHAADRSSSAPTS